MSDVARDIDEIRDYLQGRLSDEEKLVFQDRLAREPSLVRELEQSVRMREALRQLQAEGYFATRAQRTRAMSRWLLPVAAAAAIAVVCINVWRDAVSVLSASTTVGGVTQPVVDYPRTFVSMRDNSIPRMSLPSRGLVELRAARETLIADSYRLTLIRRQGQVEQRLGSVTGLVAGSDGYIRAYVDSARIGPGSYSLRIESESGSPAGVKDYPFTLEAAKTSSSK